VRLDEVDSEHGAAELLLLLQLLAAAAAAALLLHDSDSDSVNTGKCDKRLKMRYFD
jgi:hypothetical protein